MATSYITSFWVIGLMPDNSEVTLAICSDREHAERAANAFDEKTVIRITVERRIY